MARYHINDKDEIGVCSAKFQCQFDMSEEEHFPNKKTAETALASKLKGKMDEIPKSVKKKTQPTEFKDFVTTDRNGNEKILKAGVWSSEASILLKGRQSLAFAVEFAKKNKGAGIQVWYDKIPQLNEDGSPTVDEYGDPVYREDRGDFIQAFAVDKNGWTVWDADGESDPVFISQFIDESSVESFDKFSIEEAESKFGSRLPEQNYGFAASFVDDAAQNPIKRS